MDRLHLPKTAEILRGDTLLLTAKSAVVLRIHLLDIRGLKDCVNLGDIYGSEYLTTGSVLLGPPLSKY